MTDIKTVPTACSATRHINSVSKALNLGHSVLWSVCDIWHQQTGLYNTGQVVMMIVQGFILLCLLTNGMISYIFLYFTLLGILTSQLCVFQDSINYLHPGREIYECSQTLPVVCQTIHPYTGNCLPLRCLISWLFCNTVASTDMFRHGGCQKPLDMMQTSIPYCHPVLFFKVKIHFLTVFYIPLQRKINEA